MWDIDHSKKFTKHFRYTTRSKFPFRSSSQSVFFFKMANLYQRPAVKLAKTGPWRVNQQPYSAQMSPQHSHPKNSSNAPRRQLANLHRSGHPQNNKYRLCWQEYWPMLCRHQGRQKEPVSRQTLLRF